MRKLLVTVLGLGAIVATTAVAAKKQTNRQVIDRYMAIVDAKQLEKFAEIDDADLVMKVPMGVVKGVDGHRQLTRGFATAFPNFKHVINQCIEAGEWISCEGKFGGDHTGPMMMPDGKSIPATHKHIEFDFAGYARIKNGKVAQMHVYFDTMGMMQQLGVIPAPGPAQAAR